MENMKTEKVKQDIVEINQDATTEEILEFINQAPKKSNPSIDEVLNEDRSSVHVSAKELGLTKEDIAEIKEFSKDGFNDVTSYVTIDNGTDDASNELKQRIIAEKKAKEEADKKRNEEIVEGLSSDPTLSDAFYNSGNTSAISMPLADLDSVETNDEEKEIYLDAVLTAKRFELKIKGKKSNIVYHMRSKTLEEQDAIVKKVQEYASEIEHIDVTQDGKLVSIPKIAHSDPQIFVYAVKLNLIFAVTSINGKDVFGAKDYLDGKTNINDFINNGIKVFKTLPIMVLNNWINAARIFEKKENLLAKLMLTEDF